MTTVTPTKKATPARSPEVLGVAKSQLIKMGASRAEAHQIVGRAKHPRQLPHAARFARALVAYHGGDDHAVSMSRIVMFGVKGVHYQPMRIVKLFDAIFEDVDHDFSGWRPRWPNQVKHFMHDALLCLDSPGLIRLSTTESDK